MGSFHNWHASSLRKMLLISCNCFIWSHVEVNSRFAKSVSRWTVLSFFFFKTLFNLVHSLGLSNICAKLFKRFSPSNKSDWISIPKWKLHDPINFTESSCVGWQNFREIDIFKTTLPLYRYHTVEFWLHFSSNQSTTACIT